MNEPVDVVIVGGGPAGSTLAAILKRYRPEATVRILERERFPRFHVGETLVAEINVVLAEMGAYEAVNRAGFVRKYGATFRWGAAPEPWHLLFATMEESRSDAGQVQTAYTWHVDRGRYDAILLETAVNAGAELVLDAATGLVEEEGRVVGVVGASGRVHRARFVVDATGQSGLDGSATERVMDPHLRNVAYWGYYRGLRFDEALNGTPERSRAFIVAHPAGWSWCFPIREDLASVGVITRVGAAPTGGPARSPERHFADAVAGCPELAGLLADAELVPYDAGAPLVHVVRDFSYVAGRVWRPGLVRTGDAAGFVDPILSVGCFLAQSSARHLAYSLGTLLAGGGVGVGAMGAEAAGAEADGAGAAGVREGRAQQVGASGPTADGRRTADGLLDEATVLDAYADHTLDTLLAFRELTWFFYKFNARKDEWWALARDLIDSAGLPAQANDRQAFLAFASGFAARRAVHREPNGVFGEPFFADAFRHLVAGGAAPASPPPPPRLSRTDRPALIGPLTQRASAVPLDGTGRVIPALRVEVRPPGSEAAALIRRLYVPPTMAPLFDWLDGSADVVVLAERLERELDSSGMERAMLVRYVRGVVAGMLERGLVRV